MSRLKACNSFNNYDGGDDEDDDGWDRISRLPDDVLVSIVSLLPLTDAVKTCVLSHRWEQLWTYSTGTLSFFCPLKRLWISQTHPPAFAELKAKFIRWVNHTVRVHQGPSVQELRILFDGLDAHSASDIDAWVYFAIRKGVQRLELDFMPHAAFNNYYHFPNINLLHRQPGQGAAIEGFSSFINSLKEISLMMLTADEQLVQFFLTSCPLLEKLCLHVSCPIVNLQVAGLPSLKHLDIGRLCNLENFEISAPNLVFFKYSGQVISINLKNVPQLVHAYYEGFYAENLLTHMSDHSSSLSQLESLTLSMIFLESPIRETPVLLNNLRKLELLFFIVVPEARETLLHMTTHLLKAAPFLHTFVLQLDRESYDEPDKRDVCKVPARFPHQYLKVVQLTGFVGHTIDFELAIHLLETAISIEKMIINLEVLMEAQVLAEALKEKLPVGAELLVI